VRPSFQHDLPNLFVEQSVILFDFGIALLLHSGFLSIDEVEAAVSRVLGCTGVLGNAFQLRPNGTFALWFVLQPAVPAHTIIYYRAITAC